MPGGFLHWVRWPCSCTSSPAWGSWARIRARLTAMPAYSARKFALCWVSARRRRLGQPITRLTILAACTTAARCASPAVPCCSPTFPPPYHQRRLFRRIFRVLSSCAGHPLPAQRILLAAHPRSSDPLCLTQPLRPLDGDIRWLRIRSSARQTPPLPFVP